MSKKIRVAIVGVGNCASALVQGVSFYRGKDIPASSGISFPDIGGYHPGDIEFVAAYDVDKRKVGLCLDDAIWALPNNCFVIDVVPQQDADYPVVRQAPRLDGVAEHMSDYPVDEAFDPIEHDVFADVSVFAKHL